MSSFQFICAFLTFAFVVSLTSGEYFEECNDVPADSYVALKDECRSYIYCSDDENYSFRDECPDFTYFNASLQQCMADNDNVCPLNDVELASFAEHEKETDAEDADAVIVENENTSEKPSSPSAGNVNIDETVAAITTPKPIIQHPSIPANSRPVCERHVNRFYPHHDRCEYYYHCVAGFLTIVRCNLFYAWDYQREICVPKHEAHCYGHSKLWL